MAGRSDFFIEFGSNVDKFVAQLETELQKIKPKIETLSGIGQQALTVDVKVNFEGVERLKDQLSEVRRIAESIQIGRGPDGGTTGTPITQRPLAATAAPTAAPGATEALNRFETIVSGASGEVRQAAEQLRDFSDAVQTASARLKTAAPTAATPGGGPVPVQLVQVTGQAESFFRGLVPKFTAAKPAAAGAAGTKSAAAPKAAAQPAATPTTVTPAQANAFVAETPAPPNKLQAKLAGLIHEQRQFEQNYSQAVQALIDRQFRVSDELDHATDQVQQTNQALEELERVAKQKREAGEIARGFERSEIERLEFEKNKADRLVNNVIKIVQESYKDELDAAIKSLDLSQQSLEKFRDAQARRPTPGVVKATAVPIDATRLRLTVKLPPPSPLLESLEREFREAEAKVQELVARTAKDPMLVELTRQAEEKNEALQRFLRETAERATPETVQARAEEELLEKLRLEQRQAEDAHRRLVEDVQKRDTDLELLLARAQKSNELKQKALQEFEERATGFAGAVGQVPPEDTATVSRLGQEIQKDKQSVAELARRIVEGSFGPQVQAMLDAATDRLRRREADLQALLNEIEGRTGVRLDIGGADDRRDLFLLRQEAQDARDELEKVTHAVSDRSLERAAIREAEEVLKRRTQELQRVEAAMESDRRVAARIAPEDRGKYQELLDEKERAANELRKLQEAIAGGGATQQQEQLVAAARKQADAARDAVNNFARKISDRAEIPTQLAVDPQLKAVTQRIQDAIALANKNLTRTAALQIVRAQEALLAQIKRLETRAIRGTLDAGDQQLLTTLKTAESRFSEELDKRMETMVDRQMARMRANISRVQGLGEAVATAREGYQGTTFSPAYLQGVGQRGGPEAIARATEEQLQKRMAAVAEGAERTIQLLKADPANAELQEQLRNLVTLSGQLSDAMGNQVQAQAQAASRAVETLQQRQARIAGQFGDDSDIRRMLDRVSKIPEPKEYLAREGLGSEMIQAVSKLVREYSQTRERAVRQVAEMVGKDQQEIDQLRNEMNRLLAGRGGEALLTRPSEARITGPGGTPQGARGAVSQAGIAAEAVFRGDWLQRTIETTGAMWLRSVGSTLAYTVLNSVQEGFTSALSSEQTGLRVMATLQAQADFAAEQAGESAGTGFMQSFGEAAQKVPIVGTLFAGIDYSDQKGVLRDIRQVAIETGQSLEDVSESAAQLAGLVTSKEELISLVRIVQQLQVVSGGALNTTEAFRTMGSVISSFGLEGEAGYRAIADQAVRLQEITGTNIEDTEEGMARIGAQAKAMGFTFQETGALIASTAKITGQSGQAISEPIGRILSAFQTPKLRQAFLGAIGPESKSAFQDAFRQGTAEVFKFMLAHRQEISSAEATALGTLAGPRQAFVFTALLNNLEQLAKATEGASNATDALEKRYADYMLTVGQKIQQFKTTFAALIAAMGQAGVFAGIAVGIGVLEQFLKVILSIVEAFNHFTEILGPFGIVLKGLIALISAAGALKAGSGLIQRFQSAAINRRAGFGISGQTREQIIASSPNISEAGANRVNIAYKQSIKDWFRRVLRGPEEGAREAIREVDATTTGKRIGTRFRDFFRTAGDVAVREAAGVGAGTEATTPTTARTTAVPAAVDSAADRAAVSLNAVAVAGDRAVAGLTGNAVITETQAAAATHSAAAMNANASAAQGAAVASKAEAAAADADAAAGQRAAVALNEVAVAGGRAAAGMAAGGGIPGFGGGPKGKGIGGVVGAAEEGLEATAVTAARAAKTTGLFSAGIRTAATGLKTLTLGTLSLAGGMVGGVLGFAAMEGAIALGTKALNNWREENRKTAEFEKSLRDDAFKGAGFTPEEYRRVIQQEEQRRGVKLTEAQRLDLDIPQLVRELRASKGGTDSHNVITNNFLQQGAIPLPDIVTGGAVQPLGRSTGSGAARIPPASKVTVTPQAPIDLKTVEQHDKATFDAINANSEAIDDYLTWQEGEVQRVRDAAAGKPVPQGRGIQPPKPGYAATSNLQRKIGEARQKAAQDVGALEKPAEGDAKAMAEYQAKVDKIVKSFLIETQLLVSEAKNVPSDLLPVLQGQITTAEVSLRRSAAHDTTADLVSHYNALQAEEVATVAKTAQSLAGLDTSTMSRAELQNIREGIQDLGVAATDVTAIVDAISPVEKQKALVAVLENVLSRTQELYRAGTASSDDLIAAQNAVNEARMKTVSLAVDSATKEAEVLQEQGKYTEATAALLAAEAVIREVMAVTDQNSETYLNLLQIDKDMRQKLVDSVFKKREEDAQTALAVATESGDDDAIKAAEIAISKLNYLKVKYKGFSGEALLNQLAPLFVQDAADKISNLVNGAIAVGDITDEVGAQVLLLLQNIPVPERKKGESLEHLAWQAIHDRIQPQVDLVKGKLAAVDRLTKFFNKYLSKTGMDLIQFLKSSGVYMSPEDRARLEREISGLEALIGPEPKATETGERPVRSKEDETAARQAAAQAKKDEAKQKADQAEEIRRARQEYYDSLIKDPIARAKAEIEETRRRIAYAKGKGKEGAVEYWNLLKQLNEQQMGLADLVRARAQATNELASAYAEVRGDTVKVAEIAVQNAAIALEQAIANTGAGSAESDQARAAKVRAEGALRDAKLEKQLGDIEFMREFDQISTDTARRMYNDLLKQADLTEEQRRDIMRRIKALDEEVSGQFDLGDIRMPTVYEVRRFMTAAREGVTYLGDASTRVTHDMMARMDGMAGDLNAVDRMASQALLGSFNNLRDTLNLLSQANMDPTTFEALLGQGVTMTNVNNNTVTITIQGSQLNQDQMQMAVGGALLDTLGASVRKVQ